MPAEGRRPTACLAIVCRRSQNPVEFLPTLLAGTAVGGVLEAVHIHRRVRNAAFTSFTGSRFPSACRATACSLSRTRVELLPYNGAGAGGVGVLEAVHILRRGRNDGRVCLTTTYYVIW